jgi:voltage-gated potassium channel
MIWLALIVETIVLSFVVKDFKAYLKSNWMIFPVLVLTFPMILGEIPYAVLIRAVQVLMLARALHSTVQSTRKIFQRSHLGAIILGYLFVIIVAGIAIHSIDPNVKSVEDGLWWAIVTMATLGYGDVVPTSTEGRLFASIIIVLGAVFFSLLTAQIAAYMVGEEEAHREIEILRITRENNARLEKMTFREDEKVISAIHALNARLDHIEKMLEQKLKDSAS